MFWPRLLVLPRTRTRLSVLLGLVALAVGCDDRPPPAQGNISVSESRQLVRDLNVVRRHNGKPPVRYSRTISLRSRAWSKALADRGYLTHHMPPPNSTWGEILYVGPEGTAQAVNAWLASPPHKAVMLESFFKSAGAGRIRRNGRTYWTARFH